MPITKSRQIAKILKLDGTVKDSLYDSDAIVTSAQLGVTPAAGTAIYSSADTLPASADNGDQALVSSTNRLYIFTNGGWYNIALINTSPYFTTSPDAAYDLSTIGAATVITILAVDSDGVPITYTATTDSDFDGIATVTRDSDSGRTFTVTPIDSEGGTSVAGTGTITFKASDGVNLVSTVSTFSISFTINNSNHTTLLLTIDSTATDNQVDASSNNHTITEAGDVKSTAFTPYHPGGYSSYFDGVDDRLTVASNSDFNIGSDFTFECWCYPTSSSNAGASGNALLMLVWNGSNNSVWLSYNSATKFEFRISYVGGWAHTLTSTDNFALNQWYHVAATRNSGTTYLFINGVQQATGSNNTDVSSTGNTVSIGSQGTGRYFQGYIKDARIVNGTAVYTSAFTPPTAPLTAITNTKLLTCHLPYIADGSSNDHTITIAGNTTTKRFGPYDYGAYGKATHGGSVYFDGSGDYLTVPDGAYKTYGSGNFTIEMWFYADAAFPYNWLLADPNNAFTTSTMSVGIYLENSNVKAQVITSAGTRSLNHTTSVYQNTWNHIAVTRNGTALTLWINGVANTPTTISGSDTVNDSSNILNIGRGSVDYPLNFSGYISDFRIVKGTAVYTSAFTPPTAPLTAITNTSLLTCTNKSQVWDVSGSELPGPVYNNGASIQSGVTHTGFNAGYFLFDGTNDWIQIPYDLHQNANFGTGDFTIEFWLYPHVDELSTMIGNDIATPGNWNGWLIKRNSAPSQNTLYLQWNGSGMIETSLATAGAGTYTVNTWHHFAATRQNGTLRTFFNGNLIGSTSFTADMTDTNYLTIGMNNYAGGTEHFDGALKEIRFTKGLARYTSTFTPPTAEFKG